MTTAVIVLYPRHHGSRFDLTYYGDHHLPLVWRLLEPAGLLGVRISEPAAPDQSFHLIAALLFAHLPAALKALGEHDPTLRIDVTRFTDVVPTIFLADE